MRALRWHGKHDIRCDNVPGPDIEHGRDAILKVSSCAIGGSDLQLFDGLMPGMQTGSILGREFMGEVVALGADTQGLQIGDRVVVPFSVSCGQCDQCRRGNFAVCERSSVNAAAADKRCGHSTGQSTAGRFGSAQRAGGYPGGQAEYVRVPFADAGPVKIPDSLSDEQVLFLSDIFPTGWQAAVACDIQPSDTVAVWGAGPVGQFAVRSAILLGARQVVCIDRVPERLQMAQAGGAVTIHLDAESVHGRLQALTQGKGPEKCIAAVGLQARVTHPFDALVDRARHAVLLEGAGERPHVLHAMIDACRPGGVLSIAGAVGGCIDKLPFATLMHKGLTLRSGLTHVARWTDGLLARIEDGQIDPSFVITHTADLGRGPELYQTLRDQRDGCIKVVLRP